MNNGVFMEYKDELRVYCFLNCVKEIPLKRLENAIISLESGGYYKITEIKNRKINPNELYVVKEGKVLENPMDIGVLKKNNLGDTVEVFFELLECIDFESPNYHEFTYELIKNGYYKADKKYFNRAINRDKSERRRK